MTTVDYVINSHDEGLNQVESSLIPRPVPNFCHLQYGSNKNSGTTIASLYFLGQPLATSLFEEIGLACL